MQRTQGSLFNWSKYPLHYLLFTVAILVYANTWQHGYAWDDAIVITANDRVLAGWDQFPELFQNIRTEEIAGTYGYRPVTLLTFATEIEIFGRNPFWPHLINTILYALLGLLLFQTLQRLFPKQKQPILFWIVLLFLLHPIHTEVVANIKSRDEILALIFGLLAIRSFLQFLERKNWVPLTLSALWISLAFLSKESAITFVGVLFILPFFQSGGFGKQAFLRAMPALGILGLLLGIRAFSFSESIFTSDWQKMLDTGMYLDTAVAGNPIAALGNRWDILPNTIYLAWWHVQKFLFPWPLLHDYSFNQLPIVSWISPMVWFALITMGGAFFLSVKYLTKHSPAAFGLLFFFLTISIYLHLIIPGADITAERFLFAPSIGLCVALVFGIQWLVKKLSKPWFFQWVLAPICLVFAFMTIQRNPAWASSETLLKTDLPQLENCARAHFNYASVLHHRYYDTPAFEKLIMKEKILYHYEKTISLTDAIFPAFMDLGAAYMEFGESEKGRSVFQKTIEKFPELSAPYFEMGRYYVSQNDFKSASIQFLKALELGKANTQSYYLGALSLTNIQEPEKALALLDSGLFTTPNFVDYYLLHAKLDIGLGKVTPAIQILETALEKFPEEKLVYVALLAISKENHMTQKNNHYQQLAKERDIRL